jgi:hypothetical protein
MEDRSGTMLSNGLVVYVRIVVVAFKCSISLPVASSDRTPLGHG